MIAYGPLVGFESAYVGCNDCWVRAAAVLISYSLHTAIYPSDIMKGLSVPMCRSNNPAIALQVQPMPGVGPILVRPASPTALWSLLSSSGGPLVVSYDYTCTGVAPRHVVVLYEAHWQKSWWLRDGKTDIRLPWSSVRDCGVLRHTWHLGRTNSLRRLSSRGGGAFQQHGVSVHAEKV